MRHKIKHWIFEGIDRLGKDSLINNIKQKLGFHQVIHYSKPEILACYASYSKYVANTAPGFAQMLYQEYSFDTGFKILNSPVPTIFNRFHLGECVYAPLYRQYSGDYVFTLERVNRADELENTRLVLLTTSNFDMLKDDGLSFDFDKKEIEQQKFLEAFRKSIMPDKRIIDVYDGNGGYKDYMQIYEEVIN